MTRPLVRTTRRMVGALLALGLATSGLTACQQEEETTLIAFLLASDQAYRWQSADEPTLRKRVKRTCRGCEYVTYNAGDDPRTQADQFQQALDDGADAIVLNAVNSEQAEVLIEAAGSVPVIAYDRFVPGADYYVSYDATVTGQLQANATVSALGGRGSILVVNGPQTDANGVAIKRARNEVFAASRIRVLDELDPLTWSGEEAGEWVTLQLENYPIRRIDAIVAASDGQAEGIVGALTAAGVGPRRFPFITGQDAELTALRRIVRAEQGMTVYKPITDQAQQAADIAVTLVTGGTVTGTTDFEGVPSFIFDPRQVTVENLTNTVVREGLYSTAEICDEATTRRCVRLGIH